MGLNVAALSTDPPELLAALVDREHLGFPWLSDTELKWLDAAGLRHRSAHAGRDIAQPASILVAEDGTILWTFQGPTIQFRAGAAEVLETARRLLPGNPEARRQA